jgi:hypothetical protein
VAELRTAHPDEYGVLVAQPDWAAMGTRFGKQMGPVVKAIKALTPVEIRSLRKEGSMELAGHQISMDEVSFVCSSVLRQDRVFVRVCVLDKICDKVHEPSRWVAVLSESADMLCHDTAWLDLHLSQHLMYHLATVRMHGDASMGSARWAT